MIKKISELLDAKLYQDLIRMLKPIIDSDSASIEHHYAYAISTYFTNDYNESLKSCSFLLRSLTHHAPMEIFQISRTILNSQSREAQAFFWNQCTDLISLAFQASYDELIKGKLHNAKTHFNHGLDLVLNDEEEKKLWEKSFDIIANSFLDIDIHYPVYNQKKVKKIITSGKGWSGSSALFDFFSEFENVASIPIETQYIESNKGIANLIESSQNKTNFKIAVIDFFFHCMLGYVKYQDSESWKIFNGPRTLFESPLSRKYSINSYEISKLFAETVKNFNENTTEKIKTLSDQIVNRLAIVGLDENKDFALLDNVIHIQKIHLIEYLDDVKIFCTIRDPRSTFASLSQKKFTFNKTCSEYIAEESIVIPSALKKIYELIRKNNQKREVYKVQYEEFVLDENYRNELAKKAGLSPTHHQRHSAFKPWESEKSLYRHLEHENKSEIEQIEKALYKYCIDLPEKKTIL